MSNYPKCEDCIHGAFTGRDNEQQRCAHVCAGWTYAVDERMVGKACGPTGKLFRPRNPQPAQSDRLTVRQEVALRILSCHLAAPGALLHAPMIVTACRNADDFLRIEQETRPK